MALRYLPDVLIVMHRIHATSKTTVVQFTIKTQEISKLLSFRTIPSNSQDIGLLS